MRKYKVEFIQTEKFIIDVKAESEQEATDKATQKFGSGDCQEVGDCKVEIGTVYDVTDTDDPFDG